MTGLRVLVCGGRGFSDREALYEALNRVVIERGPFEVLIHGDASGADTLASDWAIAHGVAPIAVPANWTNISTAGAVIRIGASGRRYNAAAGVWRNARMLSDHAPDLVIAFPGGKGTADMMERARAAGVEVIEVET